MRKFVLSLLLTSAAASPALAEDRGWHHGQQQDASQQDSNRQQAREAARAERANDGGNKEQAQQDRGSRSGGWNRTQATQQVEQRQVEQRQVEQRQVVDQNQRGSWDRSRFAGRPNVTQQVEVQQQYRQRYQQQYQQQPQQQYQQQYQQQTQRSGSWTRDRNGWNGQAGNYRQSQSGQQQAYNRSRSGSWNRDWRNDRRYDWRNYRNSHRSIFQLGAYYDPFGYGYRQFDIGFRLNSGYFGQQYWIDPAMYQLPYPPPGTQWVRYWNDAILVDVYSGQVVDVIRNFFW